MGTLRHPQTKARRQRGASLLESMIAFVVLAAGTVGIGQWQGQLRLGADIARQRAQALRLGRTDIESLRAPVVPVDADTTLAPAADGTRYRVLRRLVATGLAGATPATVRVAWTDRSGTPRDIGLAAIVGIGDAGFAGALSLGPGAVPEAARGGFGRSPGVPIGAHDLGDGRSAWKPASAGSEVLVFDNASAEIVARCSAPAALRDRDLDNASLTGCSAEHSVLVSGTLRFASGWAPAAAVSLVLGAVRDSAMAACQSEARKTVRFEAGGSLRIEDVALEAAPASVGAAAWREEGEHFIAWHCAVPPRSDGRWSARAELAGAADAQLCRIGSGPAGTSWDGETGPRPGQNFLVVPGQVRCDAALAAWAGAGPRP